MRLGFFLWGEGATLKGAMSQLTSLLALSWGCPDLCTKISNPREGPTFDNFMVDQDEAVFQ